MNDWILVKIKNGNLEIKVFSPKVVDNARIINKSRWLFTHKHVKWWIVWKNSSNPFFDK